MRAAREQRSKCSAAATQQYIYTGDINVFVKGNGILAHYAATSPPQYHCFPSGLLSPGTKV